MTKTILGLDLGITSIGWALIETDKENNPITILGMGSRIIPLNSDDRDQFQKGQAISKNQDRTKARTQRKGYDRKQLKKSNLKKILQELNIFLPEELINLSMLELWKLRNDAVDKNKDISKEQLGRVLLHLNQKRGYKSARNEENKDKKDTDYVAGVKGRYMELKEAELTIGQYFYNELLIANQSNTYFRTKEKVYPREAYIEEFDKIIEIQRKKYSFLTDIIVHKLRNETIYFQRKLKSQKGLVSVCEFEGFETRYLHKVTNQTKAIFTGPRVAPKTSPLFQLCKIWEMVNNITLKTKNLESSKYKWGETIPTLEQKIELVSYLSINEKLSYEKLLSIMNLTKENVFPNKQIKNGLQGNITYSSLQKIIGNHKSLSFSINIIPSNHKAILIDKKTGEMLEEQKSLIVDPIFEQQPLYQLWHTLYSIKDLDECKNALIKRFEFSEEDAKTLSQNIDFNKQGFGNKSNKAMRKILPYLSQGYIYSQACSFAGYNHSNSLTNLEKERNTTDNKLTLLSKNSLRQPVIEKVLNQLINVTNAILEKYGKPNEIRVELSRELKQSKEERESMDKLNRDNLALNKEIESRLTELGLPLTKRYIQKYKFIFPSRDKKFKEAQTVNQCIYCGGFFNLSEALNGESFDIDHIIPKTLLFDDSQTNKVLVHRSCNANKTNKTAFDYISSKGEVELNSYLERVDDWFKKGIISYSKMQRLKASFEEYIQRKKLKKETLSDAKLWESFIDRQLRETQYIAKKSRDILQKISNNVTTSEGTVTAKLRDLWGWDDVLMNLHLPTYKAIEGQTHIKEWTSELGRRLHKKEVITNWTKRDDHRHHAIDALVVACTQQRFIQRINTLSASDTKDEMNKRIEASKIIFEDKKSKLDRYLESFKPFSTSQVEKEASKILISFKAGKKVATLGKRKVKVNGKKQVVQEGILIPRGALHEQFVYGKIKTIEKNKSIKYLFENIDKVINSSIKFLLNERLNECNNDLKMAISSLKKVPIYLDVEKSKILETADCYKEEAVLKYPLQSITSKDIQFIVDEKVKKIVKERLEMYNGKEKEAFKGVVWFNEAKKIPIRTIRLFTKVTAIEPIKKDVNGKNIGFAKPGNNHHIAIYKDKEGNLTQHICTFWNAVERKKYNIPVIIENTREIWDKTVGNELPQVFLEKLPNDNLYLEFSMQQNEMFLLGLEKAELDLALKNNNKALLSKHLYLVWSISENNFWFRHHLETKNSDLKIIKGVKESKRLYNIRSIGALYEVLPIKVRLNHLGEIMKIGN